MQQNEFYRIMELLENKLNMGQVFRTCLAGDGENLVYDFQDEDIKLHLYRKEWLLRGYLSYKELSIGISLVFDYSIQFVTSRFVICIARELNIDLEEDKEEVAKICRRLLKNDSNPDESFSTYHFDKKRAEELECEDGDKYTGLGGFLDYVCDYFKRRS